MIPPAFRLPLGVKLSLVVGGVAALTTISVGGLWGYLEVQHVRVSALERTLTDAHLVALYVETSMARVETALAAISLQPGLVAAVLAGEGGALNERLETETREPNLSELLVVDSEGAVFATSRSDASPLGSDRASERHIQEVLVTGAVSFGDPRLGLAQVPTLPVAVPIRAPGGLVIGALQGSLSLDGLNTELARLQFGENGHASLIGQGNVILAHPDPRRVLTKGSGTNQAVNGALLGRITVSETPTSSGDNVFAAAVPIPLLGWAAQVQVPTEETYGPLRDALLYGAGLGLMILVAAVLFGILAARRLTRPIRQLQSATCLVALGMPPLLPLNIHSHDELEDLAHDFEAMVNQLRRAQTERDAWATDLETRSRDADTLNQMAASLQKCHALPEACEVARRSAAELFTGVSGALWVRSSADGLFQHMGSWGVLPPDGDGFGRNQVEAFGLGQTILQLTAAQPARSLCLPIPSPDNALGLLCLAATLNGGKRNERPEVLEKERLQQLAGAVAAQLGLTFAILQLEASLRAEAIHDPLTGLFNRRYLEETIEREVQRALREGKPLGLIMLDIDHFKRINDTFGHAVGDDVLREFGELLRTGVRTGDVACRYGGEEFLLVMPGASLDDTLARAERLRATTRTLPIQEQIGGTHPLTVSAGVAGLPDHGDTAVGVLKAADQALYEAKNAGRDRTVVAARVHDA